MTTSKKLFSLSHPHGPGGVFFAWQRTSGGFLATTGYDQLVAIHNRHAGTYGRGTLRDPLRGHP